MNDRSIIESPEPNGREVWVDSYLPSGMVEQQAQPSSNFDLAWLRGALFRQRWIISATILVTVLVGLVLTLLTTPIYQASTTSRIQPWGNFIVEGQDVSSPIGSSNEISNFMETLGVVIESRNLADVVVQDLNLDTRNALLEPDVDASRPPQLNDVEWAEQRAKMAAAILQSNVSAVVPFDSQIITINYNSADPMSGSRVREQTIASPCSNGWWAHD